MLTGTVLVIRNTNKNPLENSETQDTILHHILKWKYNELKEEEIFFKLDQDENSINYYLDEMERMKLFVIFHYWSGSPAVDDLFVPNFNHHSPFDLAVANNFSVIVDYILNRLVKNLTQNFSTRWRMFLGQLIFRALVRA